MTTQQYKQYAAALNHLLNYITTDEFIELPAAQRQQHLHQLKELIKIITTAR